MLQADLNATSRTAPFDEARVRGTTSIQSRSDIFSVAHHCADAIEGLTFRVRSDDESITLRLSGITQLAGPSTEDFNGHSREYLPRRALEQHQIISRCVIPALSNLGEIDLCDLFTRFASSLSPLLNGSPTTAKLVEVEELARECQKAINARLSSLKVA